MSTWVLWTEHLNSHEVLGSDINSPPATATIAELKPGMPLVPLSDPGEFSVWVVRHISHSRALLKEEADLLHKDWERWLKKWKTKSEREVSEESFEEACKAVVEFADSTSPTMPAELATYGHGYSDGVRRAMRIAKEKGIL